jgi:uncharacterized membrane protein
VEPRGQLAPLLFVACMAIGPASPAQEQIELGDDEFEVIEDGEVAGEEEGEEADGGTRRLLGRLHPPLVHFGIAWAVLALPLALARLRFEGLGRVDLAVTAAGAAGVAVAVVTGWLHAPDVMGRPDVHGLVELHEIMGFATLGVLVLALVARCVMERRWSRPMAALYAVLLAASLVLVLVTGHLGGKITFGEDFLPF